MDQHRLNYLYSRYLGEGHPAALKAVYDLGRSNGIIEAGLAVPLIADTSSKEPNADTPGTDQALQR